MIILLKQKGRGPIAKSIRRNMPTPLLQDMDHLTEEDEPLYCDYLEFISVEHIKIAFLSSLSEMSKKGCARVPQEGGRVGAGMGVRMLRGIPRY